MDELGLIVLVIAGVLVLCILIGTPICMALGSAAAIGILVFMKIW